MPVTPVCRGRRSRWVDLCKTLAHAVENRGVLDVVLIVGLELSCETVEGALESVLGGGVDHLWLYGVLAYVQSCESRWPHESARLHIIVKQGLSSLAA